MNNSLEMYKAILLEHNEHPCNFCKLNNASKECYGNNPLCGDELSIYIQIENEFINLVTFYGQSCAICKASASLMTKFLKNKTIKCAIKSANDVIELLNGNDDLKIDKKYEELNALLGVRKFPVRIKCATLAWHTFLQALKK